MKLSIDEYNDYTNDYCGYCSTCNDITQFDGVEPDAREYECPNCEQNTLMGVEEAMMEGILEIED